jgi:hypothetical protein
VGANHKLALVHGIGVSGQLDGGEAHGGDSKVDGSVEVLANFEFDDLLSQDVSEEILGGESRIVSLANDGQGSEEGSGKFHELGVVRYLIIGYLPLIYSRALTMINSFFDSRFE